MKAFATFLFATLITLPSLAIEIPMFGPSDFPKESDWAIAMTERACKIRVSKDHKGEIYQVANGVVYSVRNKNGKVVAEAFAKNTSIFAKKECL